MTFSPELCPLSMEVAQLHEALGWSLLFYAISITSSSLTRGNEKFQFYLAFMFEEKNPEQQKTVGLSYEISV